MEQLFVEPDLIVKTKKDCHIEERESDKEYVPAEEIVETKRKEQEVHTKRDTKELKDIRVI